MRRRKEMAFVRFNSGKRGRPEVQPQDEVTPMVGQKDFGF